MVHDFSFMIECCIPLLSFIPRYLYVLSWSSSFIIVLSLNAVCRYKNAANDSNFNSPVQVCDQIPRATGMHPRGFTLLKRLKELH